MLNGRRALLLGLGFACVGAATLIACVGDDPSPTNPTTPPALDAGTPSTTGSDSGSSANPDGASTSSDGASTASAACDAYCTTFKSNCGFQSTTVDSYPSRDVCLAMCALFPTDGLLADSLPCRSSYLPAATLDCVAAGPWGDDPQTSHICAADQEVQPCTALCRVLTPKCAAAGADVADCASFCSNLGQGGTGANACMEQNTLAAYAGASPPDVVKSCRAFKACTD